jgi:hypothetical protein
MKKKNTIHPKLALKKLSLFTLDTEMQMYINAGNDAAEAAGGDASYLCIPPKNAPPFFYPNTRNECPVG